MKSGYDGPTAIQFALGFRPNVVILGIGMPGMSGYDAAKGIREERALRGVILVAITGYGEKDDLRNAVDAGLRPPFTEACWPLGAAKDLEGRRNG